jgi:BirA family transcriptional regulator, biotin operon repressor / biotin---[acetyl-CoA-carboxylase] ligase
MPAITISARMLDSLVFLTINFLTNFAQKYANLLHKISPSTSFIGQNQLFIEMVGSTNDMAKTLNREVEVENGFLLWSDFQKNGRGRNSNSWLGDPGKNIYASFILKPYKLEIKNLAYLNFACTLAVHDTLTGALPNEEIKIKWPNDLIVNGKKVAGILIENQLGPKLVSSSVFGVGINVNQGSFPTDLENVSSLAKQKGSDFRREDVLERLCEHLEVRINQLTHMLYDLLEAQYNHLLYKKDEEIQFRVEGQEYLGILKGITKRGEIVIKTEDREQVFLQGEVKLEVYGTSN